MKSMRRLLVWIATSIVFTAVFFLNRGISSDKLSLSIIEKTGAYLYTHVPQFIYP